MGAARRGFGLAGEYPIESIRAAASAAEAHGYDSFWLSQPLRDPSLPKLSDVARRTQRLALGVGAVPLTDDTPRQLATEIQRLGLPLDRFILGIGSGTARGALDRTRAGVDELRRLVDVTIVVAPLGPKMCYLAGQVADGVLLNWLTPEYARTSAAWIREGAESVGRPTPMILAYVRCALGRDSLPRLEQECARYGSFPHYAAHFRRQGVEPIQTTILAEGEADLQERLSAYEAVLDALIVRAITPADTREQALAVLAAARPTPPASAGHPVGR